MNEISLSRCSHYVAILLILVRISFATTLYLPQVVGVCKELQLAYVCDPDQILTTTQVSQLNSAINDVATSTPCPCSSQVCSSSASPRGYTVGIALVNRMQHDVSITSIGSDPVSNNDNEQAEKLNSQLQLSKLYASTLLSSWPLSRCGDTAVIFFALNESVYYTATGDAVSSLLTADVVGEIAANARISFTTNIADGLQKLLANYKLVLQGRYVRTTKLQRSSKDPQTSKVTNHATTACASFVVMSSGFLLILKWIHL